MKGILLIAFVGITLCISIAVGFSIWPANQDQLPPMVVYKSPTCGCCVKWVEHMENAGFDVESRDMRDMNAIKQQLGVPRSASSCHTAVVDGYVIEGHVPARHVLQLLENRPDIPGIAVPGMPIGSPGMEGPNASPYEVVTFNGDSLTGVYATVNP